MAKDSKSKVGKFRSEMVTESAQESSEEWRVKDAARVLQEYQQICAEPKLHKAAVAMLEDQRDEMDAAIDKARESAMSKLSKAGRKK